MVTNPEKDEILRKPILKQVLGIGNTKIVLIDDSIVEKLHINEDSTFLQQEITEDGSAILMRVRKLDGFLTKTNHSDTINDSDRYVGYRRATEIVRTR